jgi:hypothetical protein
MSHLYYTNKEPDVKMVNSQFGSVGRVFQRHINGEAEPEIFIIIPAGKAANDEEYYYHVIREDAYGLVPVAEFDTIKESVIKSRYKIDLFESSGSEEIQKLSSDNPEEKVLLCAFSNSLRILNVKDDEFNSLAKNIAGEEINIEDIKSQNYFSVMTDLGLTIFKRIIK